MGVRKQKTIFVIMLRLCKHNKREPYKL